MNGEAGARTAGDAPPHSRWSVTAGLGPTLNDLEISGTEWTAYGGAEWRPLPSVLVLDGSLHLFTYESAGRRETVLLPEVSVQIERDWRFAQPYLGLGGGLAWVNRDGNDAVSGAWHAALGSRWRLNRSWSIRLELRLRSLEPIGVATLGAGFRLP